MKVYQEAWEYKLLMRCLKEKYFIVIRVGISFKTSQLRGKFISFLPLLSQCFKPKVIAAGCCNDSLQASFQQAWLEDGWLFPATLYLN